MYVFYYKHLVLGGAELLIEKLGRELKSIGEDTFVCCESISCDMEKRLKASNIGLYKNICLNKLGKFRNMFLEYRTLNIICFQIVDFCCIKHSVFNDDRVLLYVMHYASLCMGLKGKNKLLRSIWKYLIPNLLKKLDDCHELVVMDETTVNYTKRYFKSKLVNEMPFHIVRIPIDIVNASEVNYDRYSCKSILSIARADFPFKGYLVGLMRYVDKIPDDISLDIVAYGKDEKVLNEQYALLTEDQKKKVHLHGKTNFEELERYFKSAKVYIGMGTTILDAAQRGIISVPVKADTYELFATDYFCNNYKKLVDDSTVEENKIKWLIQNVLDLNKQQYKEQALKNRKAAVDNYGTDRIVSELRQYFNYRANMSYYIEDIIRLEYKVKKFVKR